MNNRKINNKNCCVYGCHTKKGRDNELSFHYFPKDRSGNVFIVNKFGIREKIDRKKAWELKLLMGKRITPSMTVCSLHFENDDYILPGYSSKRRKLKSNAVPSLNLPRKHFADVQPKCRSNRCARQSKNIVQNEQSPPIPSSSTIDDLSEKSLPTPSARTSNDQNIDRNITEAEKIAIDSLLHLNLLGIKVAVDKGIQVKSGDIFTPFVAAIDTDSKLSSLTGLSSLVMLETLTKLVAKYFPDERTHKLSIRERIILTFIKMKTGLRYVVIASLFMSITSKTCKCIFEDMISKLAFILKEAAIPWPSSEECRRNLPHCFKNFANVRIILDCTEISVQKSKRLCCRILTYSHYKGVSPAGLITFVSNAYGGRSSDKAIFEQSGLIDKLDYGRDAMMVDKGFLIEDITKTHRIELVRPPYLRNKSQMSEEEAKATVEIAKARVHIERTNQRIKVFEIFTKPLPISLVNKVEDMFNVVCAIVNLSKPILGDDKFN